MGGIEKSFFINMLRDRYRRVNKKVLRMRTAAQYKSVEKYLVQDQKIYGGLIFVVGWGRNGWSYFRRFLAQWLSLNRMTLTGV